MRPELTLIDLDQPLTGQRRFISCWLSCQPGLNFIVDPGPPATGPALVARLQALGVARLDLILLTHVHLDHAGATATVLEAFPEARVVAHVRGRPHLAAPARLWAGSQRVLGPTATVYGEPRAVPEAALATFDDQARHGIRSIQTPGHASHHLSFLHEGTLYLGEAAGTFAALPPVTDDPGAAQNELPAGELRATRIDDPQVAPADVYLRPATPPRFILEVALASLSRLIALEPAPRCLAFAHHGAYAGDTRTLLADARDQILVWLETARRSRAAAAARAQGAPDTEALFTATIESLETGDPFFARLPRLPEDIQQREIQFARQSLTGMFDYLARIGPTAA